jgi:adenylate kinase
MGIPEISTGALFRDHIDASTPLGLEAQSYMAQGHLVPDHVTNEMVRERLSQPDACEGFILDGYPRNLAQLEELDTILEEAGCGIDAVVELAIPDEEIIERLLRRAELEGREDDSEPVIRKRVGVYHQQTEPIVDVYRGRGQLIAVDGLGDIDDVAQRMRSAVDGVEV